MRKIILLTVFILAVTTICLSFYKTKVTILVEGKVTINDTPVPGAIVYMKKEDSKDNKPHTAPTASDGSYVIQITAFEHEEVNLIVQEDGFEKEVVKIYPSSERSKEFVEFKLYSNTVAHPVTNK